MYLQRPEGDVQSFRMFTSQMIAGGTVKPQEIVKTFGVPMIHGEAVREVVPGPRVQGILPGETAAMGALESAPVEFQAPVT